MYNYSKLLGRIKEKGFTLEALAKKIGLNVSTLSKKLNNKSEFHQDEIKKICRVIDISYEGKISALVQCRFAGDYEDKVAVSPGNRSNLSDCKVCNG